jgi:hypothetical protein
VSQRLPNDHHYHGRCTWLPLRQYWRALWASDTYHRLPRLRRMPYALDSPMEYILSTSTILGHNASSFKTLTSLKPVLWVSLTIYFPGVFLVKSIRICQNFSTISVHSLYCIWLNHHPRDKWYVVIFCCQGYYLAKYSQTLMHIFWNMGQLSNFLLKVL